MQANKGSANLIINILERLAVRRRQLYKTYAQMDAAQIYKNTRAEYMLNLSSSAPKTQAAIKRMIPPESWEIPVIQKGELWATIFLLITLATTVQTEAKIIKISPLEKDIPFAL